jgi:hypothetical protein
MSVHLRVVKKHIAEVRVVEEAIAEDQIPEITVEEYHGTISIDFHNYESGMVYVPKDQAYLLRDALAYILKQSENPQGGDGEAVEMCDE